MGGGGIINRVRGSYTVFAEGFIYRFGDGLAPQLPFTANVHDGFLRRACAMKGNDKPGLGQQALQCRFIKISARYMQSLLVALPEKACELIPRPATDLCHGPHD